MRPFYALAVGLRDAFPVQVCPFVMTALVSHDRVFSYIRRGNFPSGSGAYIWTSAKFTAGSMRLLRYVLTLFLFDRAIALRHSNVPHRYTEWILVAFGGFSRDRTGVDSSSDRLLRTADIFPFLMTPLPLFLSFSLTFPTAGFSAGPNMKPLPFIFVSLG